MASSSCEEFICLRIVRQTGDCFLAKIPEMDEKDNLNLVNLQEMTERPSSTFNSVKSEEKNNFVIPVSRPSHCRFIFDPSRINFSLELLVCDRASSPTASAIHPIVEEHHQETCCRDTQEHSQQTEHHMLETAPQTKSMEMDKKESKILHFRPKQSIFRRANRFLLILFIILGVFYIIRIGILSGCLDVEGIARSWNLSRRFAGKCNPPK
ncbi:uncharacterized protein si:ch211-107e6.5 isoform X1 [Triplophysa dalaica]|uniref:uncharacterized protein si:ch211-107e6.5 isoform X1 n=2 Tax=Triplophysa dalaica TaxID=1582913 RepID=UPI0024DF3DAB|nr:uncharacterized protein si:ch211-107e6.5 isoform X1 [Triplophysa dalaica]